MSALLLDDALKPATPLTNGAINENQLIFDEVKVYKNFAKFLGYPGVIPAGCDSYRDRDHFSFSAVSVFLDC